MIEIGEKSTWKEIEIGEVFAFQGCWTILCKISNKEVIFIDSDTDWEKHEPTFERGEILPYRKWGGFKKFNKENFDDRNPFGCLTGYWHRETNDYIYKLSKETQELWKEN